MIRTPPPIRCSEGHRCWQWRSLHCEKPRRSPEFPSRAAVKALLMALLIEARGLVLVLSNAMTSPRASQTATPAPGRFLQLGSHRINDLPSLDG